MIRARGTLFIEEQGMKRIKLRPLRKQLPGPIWTYGATCGQSKELYRKQRDKKVNHEDSHESIKLKMFKFLLDVLNILFYPQRSYTRAGVRL